MPAAVDPVVSLRDVSLRFGREGREVWALRDVTLDVQPGEFVSITGPSGSGKTTLLNVVAGLERPSKGQVFVEGRKLQGYSDRELAKLRRRTLGFIFQFFGLLPALTAEQNVALPLRADGTPRAEIRDRVEKALAAVGMLQRRHHHPDELSGGEMQRVAIARVLATNARVILADEPTGNLDSVRGEEVLEILRTIVDTENRSVLLATHDLRASAYGDRLLTLRDGRVVDEVRSDRSVAAVIRLETRRN